MLASNCISFFEVIAVTALRSGSPTFTSVGLSKIVAFKKVSSFLRHEMKAVGIVKGSKITLIAPPGQMVKPLLNELFAYLKNNEDLLLIKSFVFH